MNECMQHTNMKQEGDVDYQYKFLEHVKDVIENTAGFKEISKKTGIQIDYLRRTVTEAKNPRWLTIVSILRALKLQIVIVTREETDGEE